MEMERRNVGEKTMNTRETLVFKLNHWVPFDSHKSVRAPFESESNEAID